MAQQVLTRFEENPDSWTKVPTILETSSFPQAKVGPPFQSNASFLTFEQYIGLQILEKLISTRWKTLPEGQRQGIRNFVVGATVKVASDETLARKEKTYLNKLNLALVQVRLQSPHFIIATDLLSLRS